MSGPEVKKPLWVNGLKCSFLNVRGSIGIFLNAVV